MCIPQRLMLSSAYARQRRFSKPQKSPLSPSQVQAADRRLFSTLAPSGRCGTLGPPRTGTRAPHILSSPGRKPGCCEKKSPTWAKKNPAPIVRSPTAFHHHQRSNRAPAAYSSLRLPAFFCDSERSITQGSGQRDSCDFFRHGRGLAAGSSCTLWYPAADWCLLSRLEF